MKLKLYDKRCGVSPRRAFYKRANMSRLETRPRKAVPNSDIQRKFRDIHKKVLRKSEESTEKALRNPEKDPSKS